MQVSYKEKLKLTETDESSFFKNRVRTASSYNLLIRAQAEAKKPLDAIQSTFNGMLVLATIHSIRDRESFFSSMPRNMELNLQLRFIPRS